MSFKLNFRMEATLPPALIVAIVALIFRPYLISAATAALKLLMH